jgi:glycosyltransferase involved in cell wall biosynthesis
MIWVKAGGLWPCTSGGRSRSLHTIAELSRRHQVTVITTHGPGDDPEGLAARLPLCRVTSIPYVAPKQGTPEFAAALVRSWASRDPVELRRWRVPEMRRQVQQRLDAGEADVCVADFLVGAMNVPLGGAVPVVLFEHNVEYVIWQRLAAVESRSLRRALLEVEWRKLRAREAAVCQRADLTVAVSDDDRSRLERISGRGGMAVVPTGVDVDYFAPRPGAEVPGRMVFSGSMDWAPNEDAVIYFTEHILPLIRAQVPASSLVVVGRNPSERMRQLGRTHRFDVTGTVDDVRPYMAEACVHIVPLRAGGGTRLKIFEALAMAMPVVSTTIGAEGLPEESVVRADEPDAFATAVVELLNHPGRRHEVGIAGRQMVEMSFSWASVARTFENHCQNAVAARQPALLSQPQALAN